MPIKKNNKETTEVIKKRKKYSATKVKAKKFLTNISYKRLTEQDFQNKSFIVDCITS